MALDSFGLGTGLDLENSNEELYTGSQTQQTISMMMADTSEFPSNQSSPSRGIGQNLRDSIESGQSMAAAATAAAPTIEDVQTKVETFLLPSINKNCPWYTGLSMQSSNSVESNNRILSPDCRLNEVLYQVAIADHIRSFQTMYKDKHDESRLCAEMRNGQENDDSSQPIESGKDVKLSTQDLLDKIIEGRVRAGALCRLCYGENSLEMLKAIVDIASGYALQGMWPQVSEHMAIAAQKFVSIFQNQKVKKNQITGTLLIGKYAAQRVECTYRIIREHAMRFRGHIRKEILQELVLAFGELSQPTAEELFLMNKCYIGGEYSHHRSSVGPEFEEPDALKHPTQLVALLHGFLMRYSKNGSKGNSTGEGTLPSWGEVVDFLRYDCLLMQSWVREMELSILPQNRAALYVCFGQCDIKKRGISHPQQLAYHLSRSPAASRVLVSNNVGKQLQNLKTEFPLEVNPMTGDVKKILMRIQPVQDSLSGNDTGAEWDAMVSPERRSKPSKGNDSPERSLMGNQNLQYILQDRRTPTQTFLLEIPVLWEEVQAYHVSDLEPYTLELLKAQVMTLLGVCHIFSNKLESAEESMREALKIIESIGMEQEITACELYNSIAQMMVMKYRSWQSSKKARTKADLNKYLATSDATKLIKKEAEKLKKQYRDSKGGDAFEDIDEFVVPREVRESIQKEAKESISRKRMKWFMANEKDPTKRAVEAASRYLVRSYDIVSEMHGQFHPSSGTACLAVASIENIATNYETAREWLVRALRCFEKLDPIPHRTIAFVQVQLSQVFHKQGYVDESMRVLDKAANFHLVKARQGLEEHQKHLIDHGETLFVPVLKGTMVYDDVINAMDMTTKVMRMINKRGGKWQAAEQSEIVAELAENAFGWDSMTCAEANKEVGNRYSSIQDWERGAQAYKKAQHAFEAVLGKDDRKAIQVKRMFLRVDAKRKTSDKKINSTENSPRGGDKSPRSKKSADEGEDGVDEEDVGNDMDMFNNDDIGDALDEDSIGYGGGFDVGHMQGRGGAVEVTAGFNEGLDTEEAPAGAVDEEDWR